MIGVFQKTHFTLYEELVKMHDNDVEVEGESTLGFDEVPDPWADLESARR